MPTCLCLQPYQVLFLLSNIVVPDHWYHSLGILCTTGSCTLLFSAPACWRCCIFLTRIAFSFFWIDHLSPYLTKFINLGEVYVIFIYSNFAMVLLHLVGEPLSDDGWKRCLDCWLESNLWWIWCIQIKHPLVIIIQLSFLWRVVAIKLWYFKPVQVLYWAFKCRCHIFVETFLFCKPCHLFHVFCQSGPPWLGLCLEHFLSASRLSLKLYCLYLPKIWPIVPNILAGFLLGQFLNQFHTCLLSQLSCPLVACSSPLQIGLLSKNTGGGLGQLR